MNTNSAMRDLVIVGAGGFGSEAACVAADMNRAHASGSAWNIVGFLDENEELRGTQVVGVPVIGTLGDIIGFLGKQLIWYICAIGDNANRAKLAARMEAHGWRAATLIHPSAVMADSARVGAGSYVAAGVVLGPNTRTGEHVILNTHASLGHDSVLGDFSQVCPGARVSGHCHIGDHAYLGSNAVILPGVAVGSAAVVGACSQVVQAVPPNATVMGVPARVVFQRPKPKTDYE